jgi:hypothetical protein
MLGFGWGSRTNRQSDFGIHISFDKANNNPAHMITITANTWNLMMML